MTTYRIERPHGSGDWLFVHFMTAIVLLDEDTEHTLAPGACMVFSPGRPQRYRPLLDGATLTSGVISPVAEQSTW